MLLENFELDIAVFAPDLLVPARHAKEFTAARDDRGGGDHL